MKLLPGEVFTFETTPLLVICLTCQLRKCNQKVLLEGLFMYSSPGHMVNASDYIYDTYMPIKYFAYHIYIPDLVDIFISGTFFAITCKVCIAVVYVLTCCI